MSNLGRVLAIDGWRGVAILILLLSHSLVFLPVESYFPGGVFAVDLFFVISGYIITARLLEVEKSEGALSNFYFRRLFRIVPPVLVYLLMLCAISVSFPLVHANEVIASLFFFRNYQLSLHYYSNYTMHFWSLSIEEHFYLLWPAVLVFVGQRRALPIAILGAVTCAIWRMFDSPTTFLTRYFAAGQTHAFFRVIRTDQRMDGLLVGCTLAILLSRKQVCDFIFRNFPKETPILCAFPLLLLLLTARGFPQLAIYLLIAVAIASTLNVTSGLAYRILTWRPLTRLGQLSYSLYIWQQLFLFHFWQNLFAFKKWPLPIGDAGMYSLNLTCIFIVATCSYYFVEQPCIALGKRLSYGKREKKSVPSAESKHVIDHTTPSPAISSPT